MAMFNSYVSLPEGIPVNPHSILVKWLVLYPDSTTIWPRSFPGTPSLVGVVTGDRRPHLDSWKSIERNHQADPKRTKSWGLLVPYSHEDFPIEYPKYIISYHIYIYSPKSKYSHIYTIDPHQNRICSPLIHIPHLPDTQIIGMIQIKTR